LRTKSPVRVARKLFIDIPGFEFMPPEGTQQVVRMFGVTVVSPSTELRIRFDLPERPGVVVRDVSATAEGYGLEAGDLIVEVNDVKVSTPMEFFDAVMESSRGEPVRLRVLRRDQEQTVEIPWDASDPHLPPTPTRPGFRV
jgi:S1-C subfamily serine protease